MIYTITFNPSIDYIIEVEDFKTGRINRTVFDHKYPGGKGINVSRVLNNLGVGSKALGFTGGFTGEYLKNFLLKEGIDTGFIEVEGDTRINIKLKSLEETEINGGGPAVREEDVTELLEHIEGLEKGDFLVIAGNVQNSLPRDVYSRILERCPGRDVKVFVDTTGENLLCTLKHRPFMIKPNNDELGEIFGVKVASMEERVHYGRELLKMGAQNVIVSMASEGALLISSEGIYHASAPVGVVKNSTGAGDSLIGGFIASYSRDFSLITALRWGAAAGSATAFSVDLCAKEEVEVLVEDVLITKIGGV